MKNDRIPKGIRTSIGHSKIRRDGSIGERHFSDSQSPSLLN